MSFQCDRNCGETFSRAGIWHCPVCAHHWPDERESCHNCNEYDRPEAGPSITIDAEFSQLIPPLSEDEYRQLEANILRDGCREPLVTWGGILVDGHNRYRICEAHGVAFETVEMAFADRQAVADWIDANQLGRRNLAPDQMSLLRGRRYNRMKSGHGGARRSSPHFEDLKTAEKLAVQYGVSRATIERDGQFANAVETLAEVIPYIERRIVADNDAPAKSAVIRAAQLIRDCGGDEERIATEVLKAAKEIRQRRAEENARQNAEKKAQILELPRDKYHCIVIDPPWEMAKIERDERPNQVGFDYPTMSEADLMAFPLSDFAADDCHLYLWTTHKHLPLAMRLAEHWGFRYQCLMTWVKNVGMTPFSWMYSTEHVLFCRRGGLNLERLGLRLDFAAKVREHSRKPDEFYDLVRQASPGPRIDVFSREARDGFASWGNEAEKFAEVVNG